MRRVSVGGECPSCPIGHYKSGITNPGAWVSYYAFLGTGGGGKTPPPLHNMCFYLTPELPRSQLFKHVFLNFYTQARSRSRRRSRALLWTTATWQVHLTIEFQEESRTADGSRYCFQINTTGRKCDPKQSQCCATGSPTPKIGLKELRVSIGACRRCWFLLLGGGVRKLRRARCANQRQNTTQPSTQALNAGARRPT
jgi:hypothetical protein